MIREFEKQLDLMALHFMQSGKQEESNQNLACSQIRTLILSHGKDKKKPLIQIKG